MAFSRCAWLHAASWSLAVLAVRESWAAENAGVGPIALRELTTDRPDVTESPFTVDVGHLQIEMDGATFTRDRLDGVKTTEWTFAPINLRYGITRTFEAGVFVAPVVRRTEEPRGWPRTTTRGFGDATLRAKLNFWGNDGGGTAGGLIADLKLPTAAKGIGNDRVEGAVALPVAYEIGAGWEGGAMTSIECAWTDANRRRAVWVNTITFGREVAKDVGTYLEVTSAAGDGAHVATFDCGVTWKVNANLQLDCGANVGVTRTAPDLSVFAGMSRRF